MAANNLPSTIPQPIDMMPLVALAAQELFDTQRMPWDPEEDPEGEVELPSVVTRRICRDVYRCKPVVPKGCYIEPLEDVTKVHAIIVGPQGTPYEGGFFHFLIRFPPNYPTNPPKVKLMTTAKGTVRFNPNLYKNGKVCISMLGTWPGPSWGPAQSLYTVLDAIRGVMNEEPYKNEPGMQHVDGDSEMYNDIIHHETLRVAVCGMLEEPNRDLPESLRDQIKELFLANYDAYMRRFQGKMRLNRQRMMIHQRLETSGYFAYRAIRKKMKAIHDELAPPEPQ